MLISVQFSIHANIVALILNVFMLHITYAKGLYAVSCVNASQESCLGTVVNMSTLRVL